jgi:dipeptidase E
MKKLFLSSYFSGVAKLFPDFAGGCSGKKVVFIPTASIHEKVTFFVGADLKALGKLGLAVDELEVSTAPHADIASKLSEADYIFVEGGNTFFLLQELRRTGADKLIVEHINNGKLYIGASAGSVIASGDIEYLKYMDDPDAAPELNGDFSALSIVDFSIVPHCTNFPFKKPAEKIIAEYSGKLDLRPISNNQAIVVDGDRVEQIAVESKKKKSQ